jgi:hypothetical protein
VANNQGGILDGGRLLSKVMQRDPEQGQLHQNIIDAINRLAQNSAVSAIGEIQPPKAPDSVSVKVAGEFMHVSINHGGQLQKNVRYFTEVSTTPTFSAPIVIDHGSSRTSHPFPLPAKDDAGAAQSYYVRSYAQYPGSQPSEPTVVGGTGAPTAHTMTGSTQMTLLPSTGSGTAANNGQQAGAGLGKTLTRQS